MATSVDTFAALSRAVHARSAAAAAAAPWPKFVFTADAADAFVVYLKTQEQKGLPPPPAVLKATTELMAQLEAMAADLQAAAGALVPPPP